MLNRFDQKFFIKKYKYFIFDFDGVIKESVDAKKIAYLELFEDYQFALPLIEKHHLENGGVSRFEKIPIYLDFCNLAITDSVVDFYLNKFSLIIKNRVILSEWVPGFIDFFEKIKDKNNVFIVSATPENEIKKISNKIGLKIPNNNIFGSPKSKVINIKNFLKKEYKESYIFFGDSDSDSIAAERLKIDFAFRSYFYNNNKLPKYYTYIYSDFQNDIN